MLVSTTGVETDLGDRCGTVWLSPSGASLAVQLPSGIEVLDTASATSRGRLEGSTVRRFVGWVGEQPVTHQLRIAGEIRVGTSVVASSMVEQASVSPNGATLAVVVEGFPSLRVEQNAVLGRLTLATGAWTYHRFPLTEIRVDGWLDDSHVALSVHRRGARELRVISLETGVEVASIQLDFNLEVEDIAGPLHGPWLLNRGGGLLDAWSPEGQLLWREPIATLDRDRRDVRRWSIVDGHVIGIDHTGELWQRPLPWEEQR
jgi:hypothetical protein